MNVLYCYKESEFKNLQMEIIEQDDAVGIRREELFNVWKGEPDYSKKNSRVFEHLITNLDLADSEESLKNELKVCCKVLCSKFKTKWLSSHRILTKFHSKNSKWLSEIFILPKYIVKIVKTTKGLPKESCKGRRRLNFEEASDKTKKRRVKNLLETTPQEELMFASECSLRSHGRRDAAEIVKHVSNFSPRRATKLKKAYASAVTTPKEPKKLTGEQALALFIDAKLTKFQYLLIRKQAKAQNADIFPPYNKIIEAKKSCYPQEDSITINETSAEVKLQALLDLTVERLVSHQKDILTSLKPGIDVSSNMSMVYKWGCDGASGQKTYKQKFNEEGDQEIDDSFLFAVSVVPLQLTTTSNIGTSSMECNEITVWTNPKHSSTRFCRPLKILLKKETSDLTRSVVDEVKVQIEQLVPTRLNIDGMDIEIHHKLALTMIDGKVCGALTETSSQLCFICKAKPIEMNNLERVCQRSYDSSALTYGLSSLHAWINFFECLLHISYRLDLQTWKVKKAYRHIFEARKKHIQEEFKRKMGLLIDIPKPGSGTTNDGNTARRFFSDPSLTASITGINEELIQRFRTILRTIASGLEVNVDAFNEYAMTTAKLYVKHYNWYYMPQSVHKILIHGGEVMRHAILPIGKFSEEALEARNKDYRHFRERYTRKFSRKDTMEDLFHMLLVTSDPLIRSSRHQLKQKTDKLPLDIRLLLREPQESEEGGEGEEEEEEDMECDDEREELKCGSQIEHNEYSVVGSVSCDDGGGRGAVAGSGGAAAGGDNDNGGASDD